MKTVTKQLLEALDLAGASVITYEVATKDTLEVLVGSRKENLFLLLHRARKELEARFGKVSPVFKIEWMDSATAEALDIEAKETSNEIPQP